MTAFGGQIVTVPLIDGSMWGANVVIEPLDCGY